MPSLHQILIAFRDAVLAADRDRPDARELADAFHELIAAVPLHGPNGERWASQAFEAVIAQVELLPPERSFDATMLVADALAACIIVSTAHVAILQRWAERDHGAPRSAVMRTSAKLCEYDPALVHLEMLAGLAHRLDAMATLGPADRTALGYLGIVAGRLRGEDKGQRLIELLATQRAPSRVVAAHAIGYSVAMDPPTSQLSVFARFGPSRLVSAEPTRRLLQLFAALLDDSDAEVAAAAEQSAQVMRRAWPGMDKRLANLVVTVRGLPKPQRPVAASQPRSVAFALGAPARVSERAGVLIWAPELLEQDLQAEAAGARLPPVLGAPRLFISYRWHEVPSEDTQIDFLAGRLFGNGYDIVFDRDPRLAARGLSAQDVLELLRGCSHFLPVVTGPLRAYLAQSRPGPPSALDHEWALARRLARRRKPLQWLSLWVDGERLPRALARRPYLDLREALFERLDAAFPVCRFQVLAYDDAGRLLHRSAAVERVKLCATHAQEVSKRGCARCEIVDVTPRP
ncbi:hypothetical protein [Piscinibacter sp.]|jgi:hypothetical protein|uniref:hypothetical protein n=1 Tax=Piscinibacter sp. TaxID=1903157 RepID=UPI00355A4AE9